MSPDLNAPQVEGVPLEVKWKSMPSQPFVLPQNYREQFPDVPDECLAKYIHNSAAFLKVFRNQTFYILPSVIFRLTNRFRGFIAHPVRVVNGKLGLRGHWIIFDEDICGFLSAPDECLFTLYHRMQNPLLQQQLEDRP